MPFRRFVAIGQLLLVLTACSTGRPLPQPILAEKPAPASPEDRENDLRACRQDIASRAPITIQPRWLPPLAEGVSPVVLGTVDIPHRAWPTRAAYQDALEHCLIEHGYVVEGWR